MYYSDFDQETQSYCIFNTDYKSGFAFKSFATKDQAEVECKILNNLLKERNDQK